MENGGGPVADLGMGAKPERPDRVHTINVRGSNVEFTVEPGETVFEAAARHGYIWPTVCGGRADCTRCCMVVLEGAEYLTPMGTAERQTLERLRWADGIVNPDERLACQTELTGDVVVHRRSIRRRAASGVA